MVSIISPNPLSFFPLKRLKALKPIFASSDEGSAGDEPGRISDPVKLSLANAQTYKKSKNAATAGDPKESADPASQVSDPVKLAMERAREYKKNKGAKPLSGGQPESSGPEDMNVRKMKGAVQMNSENKKGETRLSSIDFLGFDFSEKRSRGTPPGLVPNMEPLLDGETPEVEIIIGDASKFETAVPERKSSSIDSDDTDLYKPKVSTWGVFPRPNNISKTYGGGRTIQPGEALETVEDKTAKQKRSRELIAAYKRKVGLTIDPKTKAECEKMLEEGDKLMDLGKLREALPYYEKVMTNVIFQSELHGLAALQWSICQDSLRRPDDARAMYEKLQSHPNAQVSKKAKQFVFSFQAMEMMKVRSSSFSKATGYENYFDAFVENKANYSSTEKDSGERVLEQALPYMMLLISPILFVLYVSVKKSF